MKENRRKNKRGLPNSRLLIAAVITASFLGSGNALAEQKFAGHEVLNPAELPEGMEKADYMRICLAMIDCADMVLFLPDSRFSAGAKIEKDYCDYIGKAYWLMEGEA